MINITILYRKYREYQNIPECIQLLRSIYTKIFNLDTSICELF